jgi:hypothetical protein
VRRLPLLALVLLASAPTALHAQRRAPPLERWSVPGAARPSARHDEMGLAFGGLLGFFSGAMVGGLVGGTTERITCGGSGDDDLCGLAGALLGGLVGGGVGAALGVHWTDDREGRLDRVLLATSVVTVAGTAAMLVTHRGELMLLVPLTQIAVATSTERATAE